MPVPRGLPPLLAPFALEIASRILLAFRRYFGLVKTSSMRVESVTTIALSLGYESESAFGNAFKRVTGHSPRSFATADFDGDFRDGLPAA